MLACHAGGRGFESRPLRQSIQRALQKCRARFFCVVCWRGAPRARADVRLAVRRDAEQLGERCGMRARRFARDDRSSVRRPACGIRCPKPGMGMPVAGKPVPPMCDPPGLCIHIHTSAECGRRCTRWLCMAGAGGRPQRSIRVRGTGPPRAAREEAGGSVRPGGADGRAGRGGARRRPAAGRGTRPAPRRPPGPGKRVNCTATPWPL